MRIRAAVSRAWHTEWTWAVVPTEDSPFGYLDHPLIGELWDGRGGSRPTSTEVYRDYPLVGVYFSHLGAQPFIHCMRAPTTCAAAERPRTPINSPPLARLGGPAGKRRAFLLTASSAGAQPRPPTEEPPNLARLTAWVRRCSRSTFGAQRASE